MIGISRRKNVPVDGMSLYEFLLPTVETAFVCLTKLMPHVFDVTTARLNARF